VSGARSNLKDAGKNPAQGTETGCEIDALAEKPMFSRSNDFWSEGDDLLVAGMQVCIMRRSLPEMCGCEEA
jgi:hypothetical protein